jgi:flavin reductase (DIM6/NTAB) family NADH-FMN oxidoreductase RutF
MAKTLQNDVQIDVSKIPFQEAYKLLIGGVVPRPIAWVSTRSKKGMSNLAPYSFFTAVCSNPASLLFCPVNHPDGREKDTLVNIRETNEFVINIVSHSLVHQMNQTSANYAREVSEFKEVGLTEAKCALINAPRVLEASLSYECSLLHILDIGDGSAGSGHIVVGKVLNVFGKPNVLIDGKIDLDALDPVARLGGSNYCRVENTFSIDRPIIKP